MNYEILLKFVPKGPVSDISALVLILAWRRPRHKPLSEQMLVSLLTHICVTRPQWVIGIDTKLEVIVVSPTAWEAYHNPRSKPSGCGQPFRSLVTPQWPKSRYQFIFYHDASKHIKSMQIRLCISRKSLINCFKSANMESMATDHCHSSFLSYVLVTIVMSQWCPCH